jgi:hypothetical protein
MSVRARKRLGFGVLITAWVIVLAGVILAAVSLISHGADGNERAGIGLALVMGGMLIVLMGNYIVHRANVVAADEGR